MLVVSEEADAAAAAGPVGAHLRSSRGRRAGRQAWSALHAGRRLQASGVARKYGNKTRATTHWSSTHFAGSSTGFEKSGGNTQPRPSPPASGSGWGAASTQTRRESTGRRLRGGTHPSVEGEWAEVSVGLVCMAGFRHGWQLPGSNRRQLGQRPGLVHPTGRSTVGHCKSRGWSNAAAGSGHACKSTQPVQNLAVPCGNLGRLCRCSGSAGGPAAWPSPPAAGERERQSSNAAAGQMQAGRQKYGRPAPARNPTPMHAPGAQRGTPSSHVAAPAGTAAHQGQGDVFSSAESCKQAHQRARNAVAAGGAAAAGGGGPPA